LRFSVLIQKLKIVYATTALENGNCDMARHLPDSHLRVLAFVAVCKGFSFATENVMPYARHRPCDGVRDDAFLDKNIAHLAPQNRSIEQQNS
jgi:hypothetical protein